MVACVNNVTNHGSKYSSYAGDEDGTTESHVKCQVNCKTAKKVDKKHATKLRLSLLVILNFPSLTSFNIVFYRSFERIVPVVYQKPEPPKDSAKYWQCKQDLGELTTTACIPWVIQLATNRLNDYFHELCTDQKYSAPVDVVVGSVIEVPEIPERLVWKSLSNIKRTAMGHDGILFWVWKEHAEILTPILSHIWNLSLHTHTWPMS